jgi:hypothetical protein
MSSQITVQEAATELHRLINSRVSSPRQEEIAAIISRVAVPPAAPPPNIEAPSPLHAEIARITAEYRDAWANDSEERVEPLRAQLKSLTALLPCTPTIANVAAWAEIALAHACEEQTASGEPSFSEERDAQQAACVNLVAVARALVGAAPPLPLIQPSPLHLQYRELITAIDQCCRQEETSESEARLDALIDQANALSNTIWETPAVTPADVLLRAEVAKYHENGAMGCLDDPNAHYDDRAFAQLIAAVLNVWRQAHD